MQGIHAAMTGRVGSVEQRLSASGKSYLRISLAVDQGADAPPQWVTVMRFEAENVDLVDLEARCAKGSEVYAEGRLTASTWTNREGQPQPNLTLFAWRLEPLAEIGRRSRRATADTKARHATSDTRARGWSGRH